jgi:MscS family membrane protein
MLNEVLDRLELPAYEQIPDHRTMAAMPADVPRRWRIPGTEIEIARVNEGQRTGEYLFSAPSVIRAPELYALARNLDYQPGAMEGLYEKVIQAPGPWIPLPWVRALPLWSKASFAGQAVWKWIAMVLTAVAWALLVYLAHRVSRPGNGQPRYWLRFSLALALLPVTGLFRTFLLNQLVIAGPAFIAVDTAIVILFYLIGAVAILNLGPALAATINASPRIEKQSFDAHLVTAGCHSVAWLCAIVLFAHAASSLGVPIAAVIASLGVGGIAFALAARPTLENLIAGVTLYLDKPIRIGQFCQFEDVLGTVERIGLRSTRIRRWGGHLLSVPNAQFAEHQIDNYNDARNIWIREKLRLRSDTSREHLAYILAKIRELLFAHPKIVAPRVRLIGFGDDSLSVEVICYSDTGVWAEWHAIREDVFLRIMELFEASGARMALPSKTVYFARDDGIDAERRTASEHQVREWSASGKLPFPNMSEQQREALAGTLHFPPDGSVEFEAKTDKD